MKCIICHSEVITEKEVMEEIKIKNDIIFVPIKTLVCNNCGERYYSRNTMKLLEETEKRIMDNGIHLKEVGKVLLAG